MKRSNYLEKLVICITGVANRCPCPRNAALILRTKTIKLTKRITKYFPIITIFYIEETGECVTIDIILTNDLLEGGISMKKRILAMLLILVLSIGCLPGNIRVFAATDADLVVTDFFWNTATQVKPGSEIVFSVTVKNESTTAMTDTLEVTIGTAKTVFTTVSYSGGIPAGESVTIMSQPWKSVSGDHMVAVRVNGTAGEKDKANNTMQTNLRVAEDVLISSFPAVQEQLEQKGITSLIFSDDFNTMDVIDIEDSGKEGYKWYVDRPWGAVTLNTDDYSIQNGILSIHAAKPTYNYGLATYHPINKLGFTYNKGYMEIRFRIPRPRENEETEKGVPAIWALPTTKLADKAAEWVELDWMEYWGITEDRAGGYYTISMHEVNLEGTLHFKNSNAAYTGLGDGEWHTMGWLWEEGQFIAYLDGKVVMFQSYSKDGVPMPKHNVFKGKDRKGVYSMLDEQLMPIIVGGSKANPMELDYVRVWNINEHYTADDAAAEAFVPKYTMDAAGVLIKNPDATNYTVILSGESEWTALSEAAKEKVNAKLAENGQPAFAELLTKAKEVENALTATKTAQPDTGKPIAIYAAIGVGVLVIAGILLVVIRKKRK